MMFKDIQPGDKVAIVQGHNLARSIKIAVVETITTKHFMVDGHIYNKATGHVRGGSIWQTNRAVPWSEEIERAASTCDELTEKSKTLSLICKLLKETKIADFKIGQLEKIKQILLEN